MLNKEEITKAAMEEIAKENFREAVDAKKVELRTKKSLLDKLFPYKIVLVKKK